MLLFFPTEFSLIAHRRPDFQIIANDSLHLCPHFLHQFNSFAPARVLMISPLIGARLKKDEEGRDGDGERGGINIIALSRVCFSTLISTQLPANEQRDEQGERMVENRDNCSVVGCQMGAARNRVSRDQYLTVC